MAKSKDNDVSATIFAKGAFNNATLNVVQEDVPPEVIDHGDGTSTYALNVWPTLDEMEQYGTLSVSLLTPGMAEMVGRIIVQAALVEQEVKSLVARLGQFNGTTLDWGLLSKYGQIITRLQEEAAVMAPSAPVGVSMLTDTADKLRLLHRRRGNLAHGNIAVLLKGSEIQLIATGRDSEDAFTERSLRDLALELCRASFELDTALDPDHHIFQRAPRERRFLRGFQASSPRPDPNHTKRRRRPRSSPKSAQP